MASKPLQAWVLHKQWQGDTSARVSFFTLESGLIQCLCKGGRTPKKQAFLQPFIPLWVLVDERRGWYYTRSIESTSSMLALEGSSLFSGLYLNELLYYALNPLEPDPNLFQIYANTLKALVLTKDRLAIESSLRDFEWALIQSCGYSFSWMQEARTGVLISPENNYQFILEEGFVRLDQGIPGSHLLAIAEGKLEEPAVLRTAKNVMRQAVNHLVGGREIKARKLFG